MDSSSICRIFRLATIEYRKWVYNPRMIVAVTFMIFIRSFAVSPLLNISERMQSPLNILEPYIAVLNSEVMIFACPAVFLFLISDFPKIDSASFYVLHRIKKVEWAAGQIVFLFLAVTSYLTAIFITSSALTITRTFKSNTWSFAVTNFTAEFPDMALGFEANLITKNLYNQISPVGAAASAAVLVGQYMLAVALILLLFCVFNQRKWGIMASVSVISFGSAIIATKPVGMWLFPTAHTIISYHFTNYYREPTFPLWGSFLYLIGITAILICVILLFIKRGNFDINQIG